MNSLRRNRAHWRLRFKILAAMSFVALAASGASLIAASVAEPGIAPGPASSENSWRILLVAAAGLVAGGLAALAAGRWLFVEIVTPVRHISAVVRHISRGAYTERVLKTGHETGLDDEDIGGLAAAVDRLAISLEAAEHRRTVSFDELTHEIRTPVAVLEGYLEGLLDGHVKPADKTWAMLYDEASRVHRLVDELQELARVEARQLPPDLQAVNPASIADAGLARLRLHFEEKGLHVTRVLDRDLPLVLADPDQALQALVNLLTNALRYTPSPGEVTLSVSRLPGTNEVVFRVTDTGVGIAAEHIPHLFERFFRVDRGGSRKAAGSGIGLPVAKALVEAMGGRIWAESGGPGKGSTFFFTLLIAGGAGRDRLS